jgi:hypothetical protein
MPMSRVPRRRIHWQNPVPDENAAEAEAGVAVAIAARVERGKDVATAAIVQTEARAETGCEADLEVGIEEIGDEVTIFLFKFCSRAIFFFFFLGRGG